MSTISSGCAVTFRECASSESDGWGARDGIVRLDCPRHPMAHASPLVELTRRPSKHHPSAAMAYSRCRGRTASGASSWSTEPFADRSFRRVASGGLARRRRIPGVSEGEATKRCAANRRNDDGSERFGARGPSGQADIGDNIAAAMKVEPRDRAIPIRSRVSNPRDSAGCWRRCQTCEISGSAITSPAIVGAAELPDVLPPSKGWRRP